MTRYRAYKWQGSWWLYDKQNNQLVAIRSTLESLLKARPEPERRDPGALRAI